MATRRSMLLTTLLVGVLALLAIVFMRASSTPRFDRGAPQCAESTSVANCMENRALSTLELGGPVVALDALRSEISNSSDRQKGLCHTVAHTLGTRAAESTAEPAKLLEEVKSRAELCDFGFLHGALEGYAKKLGSEWLIEYAPAACSSISSNDEELSGCVHGVGHSVLISLNGDVLRAVKGCETFSRARDRDACSSGAFMQWSISAPGTQQRSLPANHRAQKYWPILCEETTGTARSGCLSQIWHSLLLYPTGSVERRSSHALQYCNQTYKEGDLIECVTGVGSFIWADGFPDISTAIAQCQYAGIDTNIVGCVLGYAYSRGTHLLSAARMNEVCDSLSEDLRVLCAQQTTSIASNKRSRMRVQESSSR